MEEAKNGKKEKEKKSPLKRLVIQVIRYYNAGCDWLRGFSNASRLVWAQIFSFRRLSVQMMYFEIFFFNFFQYNLSVFVSIVKYSI